VDVHSGPSTTATGVYSLSDDQLAIPSQNRVGCRDRGHAGERATSEAMSDGGKTSSFMITEPHGTTVKLRLQQSVLFAQKRDGGVLFPVHPRAEHADERLELSHGRILR
jgi:hypothetical protein